MYIMSFVLIHTLSVTLVLTTIQKLYMFTIVIYDRCNKTEHVELGKIFITTVAEIIVTLYM